MVHIDLIFLNVYDAINILIMIYTRFIDLFIMKVKMFILQYQKAQLSTWSDREAFQAHNLPHRDCHQYFGTSSPSSESHLLTITCTKGGQCKGVYYPFISRVTADHHHTESAPGKESYFEIQAHKLLHSLLTLYMASLRTQL